MVCIYVVSVPTVVPQLPPRGNVSAFPCDHPRSSVSDTVLVAFGLASKTQGNVSAFPCNHSRSGVSDTVLVAFGLASKTQLPQRGNVSETPGKQASQRRAAWGTAQPSHACRRHAVASSEHIGLIPWDANILHQVAILLLKCPMLVVILLVGNVVAYHAAVTCCIAKSCILLAPSRKLRKLW